MFYATDHRGSCQPLEAVIVTRHPATVQWLRENFPQLAEVPVLESVTEHEVQGKVVFGNLPLHLAAQCAAVIAVEFTGSAPRGAEFTVEDMERAGARAELYTVHAGMYHGTGKCYRSEVRKWFNPNPITEDENDG